MKYSKDADINRKRIDKYEDFYERAFETEDIDKILAEGGQTSLENFKSASKKNIKEKGYFDAMFGEKKKLGNKIFELYFQDSSISRNTKGRLIVAKGQKISFSGKTYKGGTFLPKSYFSTKLKGSKHG